MRKNNMRTPEEKEKIIKDLLSGKTSWSETYKKYNLSESVLSHWKYAYLEKGIDGLKSKTRKNSSKSIYKGLHLRKPKNRIEELELELMKKDIEIARLKKGYNVKGVGQEKEFVTTFNKNTK